MTQAESNHSVDIGDLEAQGSISFSFSTFQYTTISISNISHNGSTVISITDPDDDYAMLLSKDDGGYVHFGNIDANISANLVILNLEANATYKLRMLVNDGMGISFTYLNASSYQLPQSVNLYGYTFPASQGSDYFDLEIFNGTAHRVTLSSSSNIEYSKYYNSTLITNANITGSKSIYLANLTTKLKLEMTSSQLFHLKLYVATPYPSSSGEGSYYDDDAIIIPVDTPETYDQIVTQWNDGEATRDTIQVTGEMVITGYEIGTTNITVFKEDLELIFYEDELYVEQPVNNSRSCISGSFRANFTNFSTDYVAFNTTFTMLVATKLVDRDGDGYPLVNLTYRDYNITKNGSTILTNYFTPYTNTEAQAEMDDSLNDNDPLIPLNILDIDNDDLGNHGEAFVYGTDPGLPDTDGDGLGDKAEVNYWTYATLLSELDWVDIYLPDLSASAIRTMFSPLGDIDFDDIPNIIDKDSDGDDLPDGAEKEGMLVSLMGGDEAPVYTYAHSPDTDLDGLNDGAEIYGYHTIYKIPAMYAHDGMFWNSLNGSVEALEVKYGAVLARDYQYINVNFSRPALNGDYRIKLVVREYTNDYQNATPMQLENTTQINLKPNGGEPIPPSKTWGFMYNTTDHNVTNNFTMVDVNTAGGHYSLYNSLPSDSYTIEVKLSPSALNKQIIAVDDILIQYRGLDPNDPDVDKDGLGDGNMTVVGETRYFMGEATFGSSPLLDDSDFDGLSDGDEVDLLNPQEYLLFTDPGNPDTDGDGLIDGDNITVNRISDTPLWYRLKAAGTPCDESNDPEIIFYGEKKYGTNATRPDTDNDGLLDGKTILIRKNSPQFWELTDVGAAYKNFTETLSIQQLVLGYTTYWAPPVEIYGPISDNPGFDVAEFLGEIDSNGADPLDNDTDDDFLPDGWEAYWNFNPNGSTSDAGTDSDNDGANNSVEFSYGLEAQGNFIGIYLNGLDPVSIDDIDGDGLLDGEEINPENASYTKTHPLLFDSDGDGLPDSIEVDNDLDPLDNGTKTFNCTSGACVVEGNGSAWNGALGDLDHDGIANLYEYIYDRPLNYSGIWTGGLYLNDPDFDDDGLIDGYAVIFNTNGSDDNWTIIADLINNHTLYYTNETWNGTTNYTFWGEGYYGTDAKDDNTDGDAKSDGDEAKGYDIYLWLNLNGTWNHTKRTIHTDPASSDGDSDFLDDKIELKVVNHTIVGEETVENIFSDPTEADTDGDGLWDVDERRASTSNPPQSRWTSPRMLDTDGDGLPDSVEPLWRYETDGDNDGINSNDTDANGQSPSDGVATLVLFRSELINYTGEVAAFVSGSNHDTLYGWNEAGDNWALASFSYSGQVNSTTADLLIFEGQPILTPDGRYIHYDFINGFLYLNDTFSGVILKFNDTNGSQNIDRSKVVNTDYSYQFLESYDFIEYFLTDSDYDGIANDDETNGFDISINGESISVTTDSGDPDSDDDGLLDGSDIYLHIDKLNSLSSSSWENWSGELYYEELDGDIYHFYGESTFGTHPDKLDTDYDGLLDGFSFNLTWGAGLNTTFKNLEGLANDNYTWNGSQWTIWHGEANWSTTPFDNDSDNDTIKDGAEVNGSAFLSGQWRYFSTTNPASNDTDGDDIDDNIELTGYTGPKDTYTLDPTAWSTDGDNISDKMEVDGWTYFVIKPNGIETVIVDNRSVTRTAYGPVEFTAYGDPTEEFTRGKSDGRLNDTVKFERGGNPWVDDSDSDSIPDSIDIELDDPDNTQLFTIDSVAPEIHTIQFKAKRDGWDLYIEMRAYVTDNSQNLNYVQLLLTTPGDHQFKNGIPITGSPGWYSISFATGIGDWLKGSLLTMAGEVYTQDTNYNWNLSSGSKRGELGKFLDAVVDWLERAKDAANAIATAVMAAINFIIEKLKNYVETKVGGILTSMSSLMTSYYDNLYGALRDYLYEISWFSDSNFTSAEYDEKVSHKEATFTAGISLILSIFYLQDYVDDLLGLLENIMAYLKPFLSLIDNILTFSIDVIIGSVPGISTLISVLDNAATSAAVSSAENIKDCILSIINAFGIGEVQLTETKNLYMPTADAITNLLLFSGIVDEDSIILDIINVFLESEGRGEVLDGLSQFFLCWGLVISVLTLAQTFIYTMLKAAKFIKMDIDTLIGVGIEGVSLFYSIGVKLKWFNSNAFIGRFVYMASCYSFFYSTIYGLLDINTNRIEEGKTAPPTWHETILWATGAVGYGVSTVSVMVSMLEEYEEENG